MIFIYFIFAGKVIVPFMTESFSAFNDPRDYIDIRDVPFCILKSFPNCIDHTIVWAREKFSSLFELKPTEFNRFWTDVGAPETLLANLTANVYHKVLRAYSCSSILCTPCSPILFTLCSPHLRTPCSPMSVLHSHHLRPTPASPWSSAFCSIALLAGCSA